MSGIRLLDGVHGKATDRIGHTGVIDLRHDEKSAWNEELIAGRIGAGSRDTRVDGLTGWRVD